MCSYSITISKSTNELFLILWNKFEEKNHWFSNVYIDNTEDEIKLSFDLKNKTKTQAKEKLEKYICECVIIYYKSKYFEENLKLPKDMKIPLKAMCRALAVFDKITDVDLLRRDLKIDKNLNINSYYTFKMSSFRSRWKEVCVLFHTNLPELVASDAFPDLIKYLLAISESSCQDVYVSVLDEKIHLKSDFGVDLVNPIPLSNFGKERLIVELISLSPANIFLVPGEKINLFAGEIKELFENKVVYALDKSSTRGL